MSLILRYGRESRQIKPPIKILRSAVRIYSPLIALLTFGIADFGARMLLCSHYLFVDILLLRMHGF